MVVAINIELDIPGASMFEGAIVSICGGGGTLTVAGTRFALFAPDGNEVS
jgi:hypothetical protein